MHPMALFPSLIGQISTFLVAVCSLLLSCKYWPNYSALVGLVQSLIWIDYPELNTVDNMFCFSLSNEIASLNLPVITLQ